jgi:diguanylate cyclase (GGDEF)-like protein
MAMITYIVHQVGSVVTMMVALYFFASIVNTLVVGRSVGVGLALTGVGMYTSVLVLEVAGVLPFAPDLPDTVRVHPPGVSEIAVAAIAFAALLLGATAIVGRLVQTNLEREAALVDANRRLEELSKKDPLTQLFNRRHILERIEEELAWLARGRSMAVVMIDLDSFKRINDQRGHVQGDALLREIGEALRKCSRATDVAGRYGGDEFVVLLPETDAEQAGIAAERITTAVRDVGIIFDATRPVTASVGIAVARASDTPMSLIERADEQAYAAKKAGGNRVAFGPVNGP